MLIPDARVDKANQLFLERDHCAPSNPTLSFGETLCALRFVCPLPKAQSGVFLVLGPYRKTGLLYVFFFDQPQDTEALDLFPYARNIRGYLTISKTFLNAASFPLWKPRSRLHSPYFPYSQYSGQRRSFSLALCLPPSRGVGIQCLIDRFRLADAVDAPD